ncbi:nuclear envelope integral membrane protein 1a-like isoform X1 [Amblyraja radiata]|uniref:nuclear envelope integral membrane protein 1a-like isoform X1 n=1 Tax=Amblyraja radiata TaxID=386614 RepID=UPI00140285F6|nr:nuclear envelope integral membrane protein 1a-like isoform X1 [Amblyraja radiata]
MAGRMKFLGVLPLNGRFAFIVWAAFGFSLTHFCTAVTEGNGRIVHIKEGKVQCSNELNHFCFKNKMSPGWREIWTRIQIRVNSSEKFKIKQVDDEMEMEDPGVWSWIVDSATSMLKERVNETYLNVDLFSNKTCFKVEPSSKVDYDVLLTRRFDPQLILIFTFGLLLFFYAENLSRSQLFFYTSGMSLGILASAVIVIFILARLLPKRSSLYLLVAGGWSVSLYLIQVTLRNLQFLLKEYWQYVLGYVTVSGFISFAVCYKYGPPEEERSINLLNWSLQLFGLFLMYSGIQVRQVALTLLIVAFCIKNIELPFQWSYTAYKKVFKLRNKPEPRRLLTEEEFQKQGEIETQKSLVELRKHCSSPEFHPWKVVSRLSTPKRFADFVEGECHLNPNESSVHEQEYGLGSLLALDDEMSDVEFDDDDDDEN